PDREEAGSPNVIGAVALGVAIETLLELGFSEMLDYEVGLGGRMIAGLSGIPGVRVLGGLEPSTAGTRLALASFVVDGLHHGLVAAALSHEWAIAVRHGCFCANPYVFHLLHMNRDDVAEVEGEVTAGRRKALPGAVRASLAPYNTEAEVDRFLEAVRQVARGPGPWCSVCSRSRSGCWRPSPSGAASIRCGGFALRTASCVAPPAPAPV